MLIRFPVLVAVMLCCQSPSWAQAVSPFPLNQEKLIYAQDVEARALATKDSSLMAEADYLYGKVYAMAGDYQSSQRHFLHALRIQEPMGNTSEIARLCTRLSENENSQRHYSEAMEYARRAVEYAQKTGDYKRLGPAYHAKGQVYESIWELNKYDRKELYDSTAYYYRRAYEVVSSAGDQAGIAESFLAMGRLKLKNDDREAIGLLHNAVDLFRKEAQLFTGVLAGARLATAYVHFGELEEGKKWLKLSQKYYQENALNDIRAHLLILEGWKDYYLKSGDLKHALEYSEKMRDAEKEQFLADRSETLDRLDQELKAEETEEELKLQRQRADLLIKNYGLQRSLNILLAVAAVVFMAVGSLYFRLYRKNRRLSIQNAKLVEEQSHRLKNQLQIAADLLSLQAYEIKDEGALDAIRESRTRLHAIALLQKKLYSGDVSKNGPFVVDLSLYGNELVDLILEACGYAGISREVFFEPVNINANVALPLALILNELITNACKYAFPGHPFPLLRIRCLKNGQVLHLSVADNGPGFEPLLQGSERSFGMQLIRLQAEQLYAAYTFRKDPETGGTLFEMEFPVSGH